MQRFIIANDNEEFIGKSFEEVKQIPNLVYRIKMKDGEVFCGTCDYRPERYNFIVKDGIIVSVSKG